MNPEIIKFGNGCAVTKLENSHTYLVSASSLQWGNLYVPTIFIEGIEENKVKFDFYKTYKNKDDKIMHCEYHSTGGNFYVLIVHTQ